MLLHILGTTGYHPSRTRQTACLMLPEVGVVLDAGTGMFRVRDLIATETLDIFLTHSHLDHVCGLTYLLDVLWQKDVTRTTVHGEGAKLTAIEKHLFAYELFPVGPPYETRDLTGPVDLPGGGNLTYFPLEHPGGSVGFRLDWPGRSMAYVTDTTAHVDAPYVAAIRGVDLLVHECNFTDAHAQLATLTGHSCTTPVAEVAKRAGVGRLILTHVNPLAPDDDPVDLPAARRVFPATEIARDEMVVEW